MDGAKRSLITHIKSSEDLSEDAEGEFGRGAISINPIVQCCAPP
jgi:hypothetical protein